MDRLPQRVEKRIVTNAQGIEGWLTLREMQFLCLATLNSAGTGRVVELGSYQGKSTSVIAATIKESGGDPLVTVDPIDPVPLQRNLAMLKLCDHVDLRNQYSTEFLKKWNEPIRFLWHDGANDYDTVREDCTRLFPYLCDGAIVAFHDVLNTSGERLHVFDELVLNSHHFGWTGVCGSIGFGRFHTQKIDSRRLIARKQKLSKKLSILKPYHCAASPNPKGIKHIVYRLLRARIPHGPVSRLDAA